MLSRETPLAWRQGFSLHRRRLERNSFGDPVAVYDMDQPDFNAQDGTAEGICWQPVRSWQTSGRLTSGVSQGEQGENRSGVLEGCLFSDLAVSAYDRIQVAEELYEVRSVQRWPGHRKLLVQRIG